MKKLMQALLSIVLLVWISGCQDSVTPPLKPQIDPSLPKVSGIKFISNITEVAFEWSPFYDEKVAGYYIYRSDPASTDGKLKRVATIKDRYSSHFVDTGLNPGSMYYYRFSLFTKEGTESEPSEALQVGTNYVLDSVSYIEAIMGLPNRIKLIWRPHDNLAISEYVVQRNQLNSTKWEEVATLRGRLNAEYIDKDLPNNKTYRYKLFAKTFDGILSKPSNVVEAKTKPLPLPIVGLEATAYLPKKIEVSWQNAKEEDISYYKVYRSSSKDFLYSYHAKTKELKFADLLDEDGSVKYYKITAVDKDGLESLKQQNPVMGSSLAKPLAPIITSASIQDGKAVLRWADADKRANQFVVIRKQKDGWSSSKDVKFTNISDALFVDKDIVQGIEYKYSVQSVDKYGLVSDPTEEVVLLLPKIAERN
jgi:fibronectin type 3 domain-containing protein